MKCLPKRRKTFNAALSPASELSLNSGRKNVRKRTNNNGKVYCLKCTKTPKMFYTPLHGRRRQQKYQTNNKCCDVIQGNCCNNVIEVIIVTVLS